MSSYLWLPDCDRTNVCCLTPYLGAGVWVGGCSYSSLRKRMPCPGQIFCQGHNLASAPCVLDCSLCPKGLDIAALSMVQQLSGSCHVLLSSNSAEGLGNTNATHTGLGRSLDIASAWDSEDWGMGPHGGQHLGTTGGLLQAPSGPFSPPWLRG